MSKKIKELSIYGGTSLGWLEDAEEVEKEDLLLKDLCARLPYGVFLKIGEYSDYTLQGIVHSNINKPLLVRCNDSNFECNIEVVRPYLRPMSSMSEEEKKEVEDLNMNPFSGSVIDWLNKHHFDYRGLIEKGLAIEAPKDMYNF